MVNHLTSEPASMGESKKVRLASDNSSSSADAGEKEEIASLGVEREQESLPLGDC